MKLNNQGYCSNEGCKMDVQEQCIDLTPKYYYVKLCFFNNNLIAILIKKNVIPFFSVKSISDIFDQSDISVFCYFATTQKFHNINNINYINEILKYFINNINYINNYIDIVKIIEGEWNGRKKQ